LIARKDALRCRNPLTKNNPIQGLLGVHSRYGLHTRAVTVYRDTLSEGFSHFVTSMAALVASGWSGCRVGLTPTGKRRLSTAHTRGGHPWRFSARHVRRVLARNGHAVLLALPAHEPLHFRRSPGRRCRPPRSGFEFGMTSAENSPKWRIDGLGAGRTAGVLRGGAPFEGDGA